MVSLPTQQTEQNVEQIADWLAAHYARDVEHSDLLILRPDVGVPINKSLGYGDTWKPFARKFPWTAIHVLYSSKFKHRLSKNLSPHPPVGRYSRNTLDSIIEGIREYELDYYVRHSDALLPTREGFVYRAPSDHYVRQFLRVGNIQKSRQALDAIFFWMLPFLEGRSTILADTWSISSIAINAARLLGKYQDGADCEVDFLPEYFDGSRRSRHNAESILRHVDRNRKSILMLFSAVRSGRSLQRLKEAFSRKLSSNILEPNANVDYLAIYSLDGGRGNRFPVNALCSRLEGFEDVERTGAVIPIDASSFFPMTARDKPLWVRKVNAAGNREFFRYYKGVNAIRIHRNVDDLSGNMLRHHAFDVSVEDLLSNERFLRKFRRKLLSLPPPSVIVIPPHKAGELMGVEAMKLLKDSKGQSPELVVHADLDRQDDRLKSVKINRQKEILILDDVSITGHRLSRFQANLRSWGFRGHVTYLVGVARPDDDKRWEDHVNDLGLSENNNLNNVEYLEKIVLPDWRANRCPWCLEYQWLSEMIDSSDSPHFTNEVKKLAMERLMLLEKVPNDEGLIDNVFWILPQQERPTITRGAIFLPHKNATEADIVASVAGAIQRMRTDPEEKRSLKADFPQPRVLLPHNFLGPSPRYNDLVLRMSVLRNALPSELRRWDDGDETQRSDFLLSTFVENQCGFPLELIVAISQKKFPLIKDKDAVLETIQLPEVKEILDATLKRQ